MKLNISKESLLQALSKVGRAINGKTTLPSSVGVYIECKDNKVIFRGMDTDIAVQTFIDQDIEILLEGQLLVDYKLFTEVIRRLPNDMIYISQEGALIDINCKKSSFNLLAMDATEYPSFPNIEDNNSINVNQGELKELINKVYFSAAIDETRPILKGTLIEVKNKQLRLVTLDGYRLSLAGINIESDIDISVVPDTKHLVEVSRMLGQAGEVELIFSNNNILFRIDNTITICRLLEGSYINYRSLLGQSVTEHRYTFSINKNEFHSALERAILLSKGKDGKNLIRLEIDNNKLIINSKSTMGNSKEELIINDAIGFTEKFEIAFNSAYIIDILKNNNYENVNFYLTSNVNPCIIRGQNVLKDKETFLVLPVRLNMVK